MIMLQPFYFTVQPGKKNMERSQKPVQPGKKNMVMDFLSHQHEEEEVLHVTPGSYMR